MINFYSLYNKSDELDLSMIQDDVADLEDGGAWAWFFHEKHHNHDYSNVLHIIKNDPASAYWYARCVLKRRWLEAEPYIMTDPTYAHWYADTVIEGPWPEAEEIIKQRYIGRDAIARNMEHD